MAIKEEMYNEVQLWKSSGKSKGDFILDKDYSKAKFEYWINRYNKEKVKPTKSNFKEIPSKSSVIVPEIKHEKTLQIDLPSGIKITVYK
ncbi:IS66 family insertion sequence element accessory protein TnpA [Brumimicrobium aurantiacum]|uniref:Transposase n=1 Tax=Brumimicrobium aurantiacum TaxID=1737063 RepID=A0A3E1EUE9_9FLAO|nr:hypothetical protein [Brumimicrobium aurantiacum]RFC53184.1 hypothetical protein DXU93_14030 [Brumimicrobium aurantiacum]